MGFGKSANAAQEHVANKKVCCSGDKYLPNSDINIIEIINLPPVVRKCKNMYLIFRPMQLSCLGRSI